MKTINIYLNERLKLNKQSKVMEYKYFPENRDQLVAILEERLAEDKNADLNDIDVSKVTSMISLFYGLDPHNVDMTYWNVSNVTNMSEMFLECKNFNANLSNWNVHEVTDINHMFYGCHSFTGDGLDNWYDKVDNVRDMCGTFRDCHKLKCDLNNWICTSLKYKDGTFLRCYWLKNNNLIPKWSI